MYSEIGIIVDGEDEKEALGQADDSLPEEYDFYDEENLEVMLCDSPAGKEFIKEQMDITIKENDWAFEQIKFAFQYLTSDNIRELEYPKDLPEEIRKKIDLHRIHDRLRILYEFGILKYLYRDKIPIISKNDLDDALKPNKKYKSYVIRMSAHW